MNIRKEIEEIDVQEAVKRKKQIEHISNLLKEFRKILWNSDKYGFEIMMNKFGVQIDRYSDEIRLEERKKTLEEVGEELNQVAERVCEDGFAQKYPRITVRVLAIITEMLSKLKSK